MSKKHAKPKEGTIFQIDLGDGDLAFGVIAARSEFAFFDIRSKCALAINDIISASIAFRVWGPIDAITSGRWQVIGNTALSGSLAEPGSYRNQPVGSNQLYIYRAGILTPASLEDVKDLELAAWWDATSIEQRLRDHFNGVPNQTVEFFKTIKKYDPKTGQEITC